jgi:hypothetical protein
VQINEREEEKAHHGLEFASAKCGAAAAGGEKHQKWSKATQILMSSVVHNVVHRVY